jgi:hypothetical protein
MGRPFRLPVYAMKMFVIGSCKGSEEVRVKMTEPWGLFATADLG